MAFVPIIAGRLVCCRGYFTSHKADQTPVRPARNAMINPAKMMSVVAEPANVEITPIPITGRALPEKPQTK